MYSNTTVHINVPATATPGENFQCTLDDGRTIELLCPVAAVPGESILSIQVPSLPNTSTTTTTTTSSIDSNNHTLADIKRLHIEGKITFVEKAKLEKEIDENEELSKQDLKKRLGITTEDLLRHVVIWTCLWTVSLSFLALSISDYQAYYMLNNPVQLVWYNALKMIPAGFFGLFLNPFLGAMSDRVGRRAILIPTQWMSLIGLALYLFTPSIPQTFVSSIFFIFSDVGPVILRGMLRDTFPKSKFESKDGGYTAIIAKKVVLPVIVTAVVSAAIYIIILIVVGSEYVKYCTCLDDSDPGLYNLNKCDNITSRAWKFHAPYNATPEIYNELCLEPGKMSNSGMNGGWAMEGALRVSMLVGLVFGAAGVLYATFALPETLRPTHQTTTMSEYFQSKKHLILKPYANVGTLLNSTPLLKVVITALAFNWCGSGFASISASPLLRMRYGITSAQWSLVVWLGGVACCFTLCCLPSFIKKFGDYNVLIWWTVAQIVATTTMFFNPSTVGMPLYWLSVMIPGVIAVTFGGTAAGILPKLVPNDINLTMQSGRNSIYQTLRMIFPMIHYFMFYASFPNQVDRFGLSESVLKYPFDGLPFLFISVMSICQLLVLLNNRSLDPKLKLENGKGLDDFYNSPYGRSKQYDVQGNGNHRALKNDEEEEEEVTAVQDETNQKKVKTVFGNGTVTSVRKDGFQVITLDWKLANDGAAMMYRRNRCGYVIY